MMKSYNLSKVHSKKLKFHCKLVKDCSFHNKFTHNLLWIYSCRCNQDSSKPVILGGFGSSITKSTLGRYVVKLPLSNRLSDFSFQKSHQNFPPSHSMKLKKIVTYRIQKLVDSNLYQNSQAQSVVMFIWWEMRARWARQARYERFYMFSKLTWHNKHG